MKSTKKIVLFLGILGLILFVVFAEIENIGICRMYNYDCRDFFENLAFLMPPFVLLIPFSLITFRMKEKVFDIWWNFAVLFVPVIVLTTIYLNATSSSGGFFNMDKEINFLILLVLYSIFVLVSVWRIIMTYRKTKNVQV